MDQGWATSQRCLIVEDEILIGLFLEETLSAAGFDAQWVSTEAGALKALAGSVFDVVVMDVILQSVPCVSLVCELKRSHVPFLVYSGHSRDDSLVSLRHAPWLEKPAETTTLITALTELTGTSIAFQEVAQFALSDHHLNSR